jgi:hypothetical protein
MNKRQLRTAVLITVIVAFAAIGVYMFSAVAQDRPHDSFTEGALPANQVQPPPTTAPAPAANTALSNVQTEGFDAQPAGWAAGVSDAMPDQQGSWASESGKLVAKAPDNGGQSFEDSIFLSPINTAGRATVSVQIYPQGNQVAGIVFRSTKNGYYVFRVFRDGNNAPESRQLLRYDAATGQFTKLAVDTQGKGYVLDSWQDLRVELDGDLITCFFNNEKVFEARDSQYTAGQAGVFTLALGDMIFDNFSVATP